MGCSMRVDKCVLALAVLMGLVVQVSGCNKGSRTASSKASFAPASHPADPPADPPPPNVLTFHNDVMRTGQNLNEGILTPANVNSANFGKLTFIKVQGKVDAEPLYVSNLTVAGKKRNVLFVVTEHDLAYAFDADTFEQLWNVSLITPEETPSDKRDCEQIEPEIGITATPVIDLNAGPHGTMYLVALSKNAAGEYFQRLHALDIVTGAEVHPAQAITATFPGNGPNGIHGHVIFDPKQYEDRAALLLLNGVIYTTWASHCDHEPYNGWIIGLSQTTLKRVSALSLTPNGSEGAIWMTGDGPAADASGNIFLLTGNGTFDSNLGPTGFPAERDFGNSFLRLSTQNSGLTVYDYFSMHNNAAESNGDEDLGSGGVMLLPDLKDASGKIRHLAIGAGKDQVIYVVNRDSMGKFNPSNDSAVYQELPNALGGAEFASPAYFNGTVYYGAYLSQLRAFPIANGLLASTPSSQTATRFDYPGTTPSISANGTNSAIVWAVENAQSGVLHAFDAANLAHELYNSNQAGKRDQFFDNKFIVPMVAGGKVYVGTPTGVMVFGLLH
jgi:outer membrane protein assembly factor BamB